MKRLFYLAVLSFAFAMFGCGSSDDSTGSGENIFFNAAKQTGPVFTASSKKAAASTNWNNGGPVFEIYSIFRDYDNARDEGVIGLENIYKLMYQAGSFFNECEERGTSIADTAMTSPFNFGRSDNTYNKYFVSESSDRANYFATKVDGSINYALLCWYIHETDKNEYGILQGNYNEDTHIIDVDLICFVDYTDSIYSLRTHLEGNSETHEYTDLRTGKWNWDKDPGSQMYCLWINGAGFARGTGETSLMKAQDNQSLAAGAKYYVIPADASEDDLKLLEDTGEATPSVTTYQTVVDALTNFDVITNTPTDVVASAGVFTGSGSGNLKPTEMP